MSSAVRSSSGGIRDLRAMFEKSNNTNEASPHPRGRSPGGNREASPSAQKIKSSFVNIERPGASEGMAPVANGTRHGSSPKPANRRESFSLNETDDKGQINELRKTISQEQERRKSNPSVIETVPEQAAESRAGTPKVKGGGGPGIGEKRHEKVGSAAERAKTTPFTEGTANGKAKDATTKPRPSNVGARAKPPTTTSTAATGKASIRPSTEANDSPKAPKMASNRLSTASTSSKTGTASSHKTTSVASKPSNPKSPPSKSGPRSPTVPVRLSSHLTAQTESSSAKHDVAKKDGRPTSNRKPIASTSHLMAPTASSKAKHEEDEPPSIRAKAGSKPASARTSMAPRASLGGRPKPRSSLAPSTGPAKKPESRSAPKAASKLSAPALGGFMARMMRPTAASANKHAPDASEADTSKPAAATQRVPTTRPTSKSLESSKPAKTVKSEAAASDEPSKSTRGEVQQSTPIVTSGASQSIGAASATATDTAPTASPPIDAPEDDKKSSDIKLAPRKLDNESAGARPGEEVPPAAENPAPIAQPEDLEAAKLETKAQEPISGEADARASDPSDVRSPEAKAPESTASESVIPDSEASTTRESKPIGADPPAADPGTVASKTLDKTNPVADTLESKEPTSQAEPLVAESPAKDPETVAPKAKKDTKSEPSTAGPTTAVPTEAAPTTTKKTPKKKSKKAKAAQANAEKPAAVLPLTVEPLTAASISAVLARSENEPTPQQTQSGADTRPDDKPEEPQAATPILPLSEAPASDATPKPNGNSISNGNGTGPESKDSEIMAETPRFGGTEIH